MLKGIGVSKGIAFAKALRLEKRVVVMCDEPPKGVDAECLAFHNALECVRKRNAELCDQARNRAGESGAAIFEAHLALLEDEDSVLIPIEQEICGGKSAAEAVSDQFDSIINELEQVPDDYIQARVNDFRDLCQQVLQALQGDVQPELLQFTEDVVLIARELTPSDTVRMDLSHVKGFVCETGNQTSHTAILARAMGIPAVIGCPGVMDEISSGVAVMIDGESGVVICSPSEDEQRVFFEKSRQRQADAAALQAYRDQKSVTSDGHQVSIYANIGKPEECTVAVNNGCEGIGLFRSEFLYMQNPAVPDEDTQAEAYRRTLMTAGDSPVTIRTLDAGGDKDIPALGLVQEENPFLGYRAIRICLDRPELFKTQLRALYRASTCGHVRIMFPMISCLEELRAAKAIVEEVKAELLASEIPFSDDVQIGMMIEIPSAAILADQFAREVDFFSIGTNDLIQYTTAVDRGNSSVSSLYSFLQPAVIRLVAQVIEAAHRNGIPCGMCGEAAGNPEYIPALIGLGLDSFSMAPSAILEARQKIAGLSYQRCHALSRELLNAVTMEQVREILEKVNAYDPVCVKTST